MASKILFTDLFDEAGVKQGFENVINELKSYATELKGQMSGVKEEASAIATELKNVSVSVGGNGSKKISELSAKVEELSKFYEHLGLAETFVKDRLEKLIATQERANRATKANADHSALAEDSIKGMKAEIEAITIAYEGLTAEERKNAEIGGVLLERKAKLQAIIKAETSASNKLAGVKKNLVQSAQTEAQNVALLGNSYLSLDSVLASTGLEMSKMVTSQKDVEKAVKLGAIANDEAVGHYDKMSAQLRLLIILYHNLSEEQLKNKDVGGVIVEEMARLNDALKEMDEAYGNHGRSVGHYEKAINGLDLATKQVARELPTLANSINTFFIAISNNIPILVDNIERYKKALESARKSGEQIPSLMSVLTKGFFGWQTLLLVGLTVLSKYGGQLLKLIFHFKSLDERVLESIRLSRIQLDLHRALYEIEQSRVGIIEDMINRNISYAKVSGASLEEIHKRERDLAKVRLQNAQENYKNNEKSISQLDNLRAFMSTLYQDEAKYQTLIAEKGSTKRRERELKRIKEQIAYNKDLIAVLESVQKEYYDSLDAQRQLAIAQYNETYQRQLDTRSLMRETKDVSISLIKERFTAEQKALDEGYKRQIQDIDSQLNKMYTDMTDEERKSLENRKKLLMDKYKQDSAEIARARKNAIAESQKELNEFSLELDAEGYDKQMKAVKIQYDDEVRLLKDKIDNDKTLTEEERKNLQKMLDLMPDILEQRRKAIRKAFIDEQLSAELEHQTALLENSNKSQYRIQIESLDAQVEYWNSYLDNLKANGNLSAEEYKREETRVNDILDSIGIKKRETTLNHMNDLLDSAYNHRIATIENSRKNERQIYLKSVDAEIQYWKDYLENAKKYGKLSADELERLTTQINDKIAGLNVQKGQRGYSNIFEVLGFGLNGLQIQAITDVTNSIMEAFDAVMEKQIEMADLAVEQAQREKDAYKDLYDAELEAMANGYANNVEYARKEYEKKLALEKKATEEKEKLQRIQEGIDTAMQLSSLVTASANIWAAFSYLPPLAISMIALMFGSFATSKAMALSATKAKTYGDGGMEYIDYGGSHASGHDIDFGRTKDGKPRRIERGEIVGVFNKRNVDKYGVNGISNIIDAVNSGTFEERYSSAFSGGETIITDLSGVERGIDTLISQNNTRVVSTPNGRIEYRGNNKRIIHNS